MGKGNRETLKGKYQIRTGIPAERKKAFDSEEETVKR